MANLKNDPSEWVVGESNPKEFTADAVVKVVENEDTTKKEVERIGNSERYGDGDERTSVTDAVDTRYVSFENSDDDDDEDDDNDGSDESDDKESNDEKTPKTSVVSPKFNAAKDPTPTGTEDSDNKGRPDNVDEYGLLDPTDDTYDPNTDASVTSSALAEIVRTELAGSKGKESPTLEACREAYRNTHEKV